jgi:hypothetical protein
MPPLKTRKAARAGMRRPRLGFGPWLAVLTVLLLLGRAAPGSAEPRREARAASVQAPLRLAVDRFQGPGATVPRAGVILALEAEASVDLLSVRLLEKHRALLDGSPEGYAKVGEILNLTAIVRGKVGKKDGGYHLTLNVHDGRSGRALSALIFEAETLPALRETLRRGLWRELEPVLGQNTKGSSTARPPEPPEPEPGLRDAEQVEEPVVGPAPEPPPPIEAETEPEPGAVARPRPRPARRCDWVTLEASGGALSRWFDYEGERSGALRAHRLRPVPSASLSATVHPFVRPGCKGASGLGLALAHERVFGAHSELAEARLATEAFASRADLVLRLPLGPLSVTPELGYAWEHLHVGGDFVPDVDYHVIRPGLNLGLKLGWFLLEGGGGGRYLFDAGQLSQWFTRARGFGYDARARIGVAVLDWLDVLGGVEFGEYRFSLNEAPDREHPHGLADGAFDRYGRAALTLRFHLR